MRALELVIKTEKVYYLGALAYFFKEKGKYYDLMGKEIDFKKVKEGVKEAMKDEKIREHLAKKALEAKEQWNLIDTKVTTLAIIEKIIEGAPAFEWDDGCTPTAAAMVLGYWDQHGYPNFPDDYQTTLIDELADAMGTWDWNGYTPPTAVSPGINKVCNNHGYGNWAGDVLYYDWDWTVNEIDSGKPFILTMWFFNPYGWPHSVTVIGYKVIDSSKYITVHDTWTTDDVDIAFGNWLGTSAYRVHPS